RTGSQPVALDGASVSTLKEFLDVFTLSVLQLADRQARLASEYELSPARFQAAWDKVQGAVSSRSIAAGNAGFRSDPGKSSPAAVPPKARFAVISNIILEKVKSYGAYNKISMQVFLRNLQVYFARHKWPKNKQDSEGFRNFFTEAMVAFTLDSMKLAERVARKNKHRFVREEDVNEMWMSYVPFDVNDYEDVIFFPKLGKKGSITIEAYDFDAFRDSGIHWRYIQFALQDGSKQLAIEPDPFAAELLAEGVAQFGVLVLRLAGMTAKEKGDKELHVDHLKDAFKDIQARVDRHRTAGPLKKTDLSLASSGGVTRVAEGKTYFDDVTQASGIRFMHRSSDWLSRLLRSYILKSAEVGTLSVPPAFGGSGAAAGDVNGDGIDDVLMLSGTGNALYLGDGKGHFKNITKDAGIVFIKEDGNPGEPRQPIIADFDNDGDQDILITYVNDDHKLYRNMGKGKFKDVSASSNLGGKGLVGGPALAFDYDNDGLLDVYIGYFGDYPRGKLPTLNRRNLNGLPNKLFRNRGNMIFEDVTEHSGVDNKGWGQAAAHTDIDLDGRQDIIVGNDFGVNVYYRNRGDGTFENIAAKLGTDKPSFTMNVGITDLNRDTYPDIYISNIVTMVKDEKYVLPGKDTTMKFNPAKLGRMRVIEANDLFLSNFEGGNMAKYTLSNAVERGFSSTGWAWGANFFDFDNDGDDDLYCVNGMNEYSVYSDTPYYTNVYKDKREIQLKVYEKESNVFFVNEGGKLQNQSKKSGADLLGNSRSTVYVDFDNDGDLDIILNNYHGPAVVYRNNSQRLNNNWLKVKLIGDPAKKTNRDAIGARIIAYKNGRQLAWREIRGGDGYLCVNPKTQHMGLGKEKNVDIKVFWPNGETASFNSLDANTRYIVEQRSGGIKKI
ncbi:MAG: CRTAC1 family protein, partial [bacterium]|nr:CRTAC1 family protein [bacterium]